MREEHCNSVTFIAVGEKRKEPLARPDGRLLGLTYPLPDPVCCVNLDLLKAIIIDLDSWSP
jgi:hypothetical protein